MDWVSFLMGVIPNEIATPARSDESRCENCEVTLRNSSNLLCSAQIDGKAC
jgi:hypothetical protein